MAIIHKETSKNPSGFGESQNVQTMNELLEVSIKQKFYAER